MKTQDGFSQSTTCRQIKLKVNDGKMPGYERMREKNFLK